MPVKLRTPTAPKTEDWQSLVEPNFGLVYWTMDRYFPYLRRLSVEDFEDAECEGRYALVCAARGFDPTKGAKFSTYAVGAIVHRFNSIYHHNQCEKRKGAANNVSLSFADGRFDGELTEEGNPALMVVDDGPERAGAVVDLIPLLQKANLSDRHRLVLMGMYVDHLTQTEIAKRTGVSKERIRQLHNQALEKVRTASVRRSMAVI